MRDLVFRGIAVFALLLPLTAQGEPQKVMPSAVAALPATLRTNAVVAKSAVTALTADEKTAVNNALTTAAKQLEKDNDKKKFAGAGSGLSSNARRYYAASAQQYLQSKAKPLAAKAQAAPSVAGKAKYVVTTVAVLVVGG